MRSDGILALAFSFALVAGCTGASIQTQNWEPLDCDTQRTREAMVPVPTVIPDEATATEALRQMLGEEGSLRQNSHDKGLHWLSPIGRWPTSDVDEARNLLERLATTVGLPAYVDLLADLEPQDIGARGSMVQIVSGQEISDWLRVWPDLEGSIHIEMLPILDLSANVVLLAPEDLESQAADFQLCVDGQEAQRGQEPPKLMGIALRDPTGQDLHTESPASAGEGRLAWLFTFNRSEPCWIEHRRVYLDAVTGAALAYESGATVASCY